MLRVSVVIPTYNLANYLPQALQSVFDQSLSPFEVIVVDDGSTDNSAELVRTFDSRLRYFRQDHKGVSAARNLGLEVAEGEVIAWLDADDLWEPEFLATVIPLLEADGGVDGVYTGFVHIDEAGNTLPQPGQKVVPPPELFGALIENCFVLTPTIVVRSRCFEQVGYFDPELEICEDYDMWLRLAETCTIVGLPYPLVKIRVHPSNTTRNTDNFCRFRLTLTQKHFGELEGNPQAWSDDKRRAHAHAFSDVAMKYNQDGRHDLGWRYFEKAISIWPDLLSQLGTFFELACGDQPRGYRGQAHTLDIEANEIQMLSQLGTLFAKAGPALQAVRRQAYGNAYLTLGILSDQAGRWRSARRYLIQAIKANPRLLASYPVVRRLLKLWAGQRLVRLLSGRRGVNYES